MKSISLISGYLFLISAIITGIAANGYLKTTEGFSKLNPTIFCIINIVVCIFCISKAMTVIPVGFTSSSFEETILFISDNISFERLPFGSLGCHRSIDTDILQMRSGESAVRSRRIFAALAKLPPKSASAGDFAHRWPAKQSHALRFGDLQSAYFELGHPH